MASIFNTGNKEIVIKIIQNKKPRKKAKLL